jgi:NADPH:quinone reductase-like Zn-dependent oxidoreductase
MRAALRERYGGLDVVELRDVDMPRPVDDQLLVKVRAASVNRADLDGLAPRPQFARLFMGLRAPRQHRIGLDVAGEVEAVGPNATLFKPGDRVFADLFSFGTGAFADYVCAPERAFLPIALGLTFEEAATLPHSAVLAAQALRLRDGRTIRPGDRVLIDGASGNVGPFAVQIAKTKGADVTGVARTEKLDFVRALGADQVIDFTTTDYTTAGEQYDWIVDTDSHHSLLAARRALKPGGVYLTLGGTSGPLFAAMLGGPFVSRASGKRLGLLLWWKPFNPPDVEQVTDLVARGRVRPAIDRRFSLDQVLDALRWVAEGRSRGKVLVLP